MNCLWHSNILLWFSVVQLSHFLSQFLTPTPALTWSQSRRPCMRLRPWAPPSHPHPSSSVSNTWTTTPRTGNALRMYTLNILLWGKKTEKNYFGWHPLKFKIILPSRTFAVFHLVTMLTPTLFVGYQTGMYILFFRKELLTTELIENYCRTIMHKRPAWGIPVYVELSSEPFSCSDPFTTPGHTRHLVLSFHCQSADGSLILIFCPSHAPVLLPNSLSKDSLNI